MIYLLISHINLLTEKGYDKITCSKLSDYTDHFSVKI